MTLVLRNDADGVATLTLNRPEKLNALNPPTFSALRAHLDAVAGDESVRCVVLTGAGRSFCAGNDLESIAKGERHETPLFAPETVDVLAQPAAADDRQDPRPLLHRRARAGPGLRPADRRVDGHAERHPRQVGPRPGVGDVGAPDRAGRPVEGQGDDVHGPAHRRRDGPRHRPRRPRPSTTPTSTPPSTRWPPRSPPTRPAPTASSSGSCTTASPRPTTRPCSTSAPRPTASPTTWPSGWPARGSSPRPEWSGAAVAVSRRRW